jgi:hypothetical protein
MADFYRWIHPRFPIPEVLQVTPHHEQTTPFHSQLGVPADEFRQHLSRLYPGGLSFHGEQFLLDPYRLQSTPAGFYYEYHPVMELVFELVRQTHFPTRPSRYEVFFACETIAAAEDFRQLKGGAGTIRRVSCAEWFRADMNLLYLGATPAESLLIAGRYWSGESSANPKWEILMRGPVAVHEQIDG